MKTNYKIKVNKEQAVFINADQEFGVLRHPVILEVWGGSQNDPGEKIKAGYTDIKEQGNQVEAEALISKSAGEIAVHDVYRYDEDGIVLTRQLHVKKSGIKKGIRLCTEMIPLPHEDSRFEDLRYFAPPAVFDKNDLDEDGYEDYFHTKKIVFREDRFNYPMFMCYSEKSRLAVRMEREQLPLYDSIPARAVSSETGEAEALFLQKTDIGSMGADGSSGQKLCLRACYPFAEGDATIGLYIIKTIPFGAFWPLEEGEHFEISYRFSQKEHADFHDACWYNISHVIQAKKPAPAPLAASPEEIARYRLESLDRYYVETPKAEDENEPAGYVLNCHPQKGDQLENIIQ